MNNPLRFAGETFYQSQYKIDPRTMREVSSFQVVRNAGWMIPYISCMIVVVGLVGHFWGTLIRFLVRREQELYGTPATATDNPYEAVVVNAQQQQQQHRPARRKPAKASVELESSAANSRAWFRTNKGKNGILKWVVPLSILSLGAIFLFSPFMSMKLKDPRGMNLDEFAKLPCLYEGRVKPLDTVARNFMLMVSNRTTFKDRKKKTQPAIRWMIDVIAGTEEGYDHQVIRIDNPEVLDMLGLNRRKGLRYSISELLPSLPKLDEELHQVAEAAAKGEPLSIYQNKIVELNRRIQVYVELERAFHTPNIPNDIPSQEHLMKNPRLATSIRLALQDALELPENAEARAEELEKQVTRPRVIPTGDDQWQNAKLAWANSYRAQLVKELDPKQPVGPVNEGALTFHAMMKAYADGDARVYNAKLKEFQQFIADSKPSDYHPDTVSFELSYNRVAPFFHAQWAYFAALVLGLAAMLLWSRSLNSAAFWLIVLTLIVHTGALAARMWISGRPPVTNLYSSAIFIGWAGVIAGLCIEVLFRLGIGNLVSALAGFSTLIIASFLATSGETMTALQAVLDTQFWLSTHVVIVALGYFATFVAGILGVMYIVLGLLTRAMDASIERIMIRMVYGVLCFALLFSFFGTVLGGLWADDSWGRFWGWDPKENGALIIVLWNALVLHARWDRMVSNRGLAALAVGGNIVTAWSWFGVNELGVGLHSYGFTEGVMLSLGIFVTTQLVIMATTFIPKRLWRSSEALAAE
jgi:ABC-type transport system involved in cytochrome c biogenesis permease subunit